MFGLKPKEFDEVKAVYYLFPNIDSIIIFGSRARGDFKYNSDIDLALKGNLSNLDLAKIIDYFDESDLPYRVDVVNYSKIIDPKFKDSIDSEGKLFPIK